MIPDADLARVQQWINARNDAVPDKVRHLTRYEIDVADQAVTIVESRPPWRDDYGPEWTRGPVAQLRFSEARGECSLYWYNRYGQPQPYELDRPTGQIDELLVEIDHDPTAIFWG